MKKGFTILLLLMTMVLLSGCELLAKTNYDTLYDGLKANGFEKENVSLLVKRETREVDGQTLELVYTYDYKDQSFHFRLSPVVDEDLYSVQYEYHSYDVFLGKGTIMYKNDNRDVVYGRVAESTIHIINYNVIEKTYESTSEGQIVYPQIKSQFDKWYKHINDLFVEYSGLSIEDFATE